MRGLVLIVVIASAGALAEPPVVPESDLLVTFGNGFSSHIEQGSGFQNSRVAANAELTLAYRIDRFTLGALFQADTTLTPYHGLQLGLSAGLVHRSADAVRFEASLAGGVHLLNQLGASGGLFGGDLFSATAGYSATLPFLGLRAGLLKAFTPESDNHFTLGAVGFAGADLGTAKGTTVTTSVCPFFCTGPATTTTLRSVRSNSGQVGVMLTIGWTHDVGPRG